MKLCDMLIILLWIIPAIKLFFLRNGKNRNIHSIFNNVLVRAFQKFRNLWLIRKKLRVQFCTEEISPFINLYIFGAVHRTT